MLSARRAPHRRSTRTDAFDGRAWLFATGYLLLQLGRSSFLIVALRGRPLGEHFVNDLVWELVIGALWVAGAIADGDGRLVLWGIAIALSHAGAWALHWLPGRGRAIDLGHTEIAGGHLIERFRLFFIIALGETVLTTGNAFTDEPFELERLLALAISFTGTVALWWSYFQRAEEVGVEAAEAAEDAGAVGWWGTWTLTLMVLALIAIAVGDELAIAHRGDDATLGFTTLTFGGPALFLLAQMRFLREALGPPSVASAGRRRAGDPRRRHVSAHAPRRHRRVDRRARRRGGRRHGRHDIGRVRHVFRTGRGGAVRLDRWAAAARERDAKPCSSRGRGGQFSDTRPVLIASSFLTRTPPLVFAVPPE